MKFKAKVTTTFQGKTPEDQDRVFEAGATVTEQELAYSSFEAAYSDNWVVPIGESGESDDLNITL